MTRSIQVRRLIRQRTTAADQDRAHGRGGYAEPPGDLDRTEPMSPPPRHDPPHHLVRDFGRGVVRARAAINHSRFAFVTVAAGPLRAVFSATMNIFAA